MRTNCLLFISSLGFIRPFSLKRIPTKMSLWIKILKFNNSGLNQQKCSYVLPRVTNNSCPPYTAVVTNFCPSYTLVMTKSWPPYTPGSVLQVREHAELYFSKKTLTSWSIFSPNDTTYLLTYLLTSKPLLFPASFFNEKSEISNKSIILN